MPYSKGRIFSSSGFSAEGAFVSAAVVANRWVVVVVGSQLNWDLEHELPMNRGGGFSVELGHRACVTNEPGGGSQLNWNIAHVLPMNRGDGFSVELGHRVCVTNESRVWVLSRIGKSTCVTSEPKMRVLSRTGIGGMCY